jgi:hypothetical protein
MIWPCHRPTLSLRTARRSRTQCPRRRTGNGNSGATHDGHSYYLKLWPMGEADFDNPKTPGVELSVMETFQFLFTNWMPRDVTADLICDHPDILKPLGFPVTKPGLN